MLRRLSSSSDNSMFAKTSREPNKVTTNADSSKVAPRSPIVPQADVCGVGALWVRFTLFGEVCLAFLRVARFRHSEDRNSGRHSSAWSVPRAGANSLLSAKCCVENMRWPGFLEWRARRVAAIQPINLKRTRALFMSNAILPASSRSIAHSDFLGMAVTLRRIQSRN